MAYSTKYYANFEDFDGTGYSVVFAFLDPLGPPTSSAFILTGTPVVHEWIEDDPAAPIKGSQATIGILNDQGSFPITNLISLNDTDIKCLIYKGSDLIFSGFIVSDDCRETLIDIGHEISVKAVDNLGTLKEIPFDVAAGYYNDGIPFTKTCGASTTAIGLDSAGAGSTPIEIWDSIEFPSILGGGTYVVRQVYFSFPLWYVEFTTPIPSFSIQSVNFILYKREDITGYLPLSKVVGICLKSTKLDLPIKVWSNLIEIHSATQVLFDETYIKDDSLFSGQEYRKCYDLLSDILSSLRAQVFQADGYWNIIRWAELRYNDNGITQHKYDKQMNYVSFEAIVDLPLIECGNGSDIISAPTYSLPRPWRYDRRKFTYNLPEAILKNKNFDILGSFVREFVRSGYTYKDYEAPYWQGYWLGPTIAERVIRIKYDSNGDEVMRMMAVTGPSSDDNRAVASDPILVTIGGKINWSFDFSIVGNPPTPANVTAYAIVDNGTTKYYLQNNGTWKTVASGFSFTIFGDPVETNTVDMKSKEIPVSGQLRVYLAVWNDTGTLTTHYSNLEFEYIPPITVLNGAIGHQHTSTQTIDVRNKQEEEIFFDDSPDMLIKGTFLLGSLTGFLHDRTSEWDYNLTTPANIRKLQQITTFEDLFWRRKHRVIFEGTLLYNSINALTVIRCLLFPNKNFIPGRIRVNYKNKETEGTWYELYEDGETDDDLTSGYDFEYLYK